MRKYLLVFCLLLIFFETLFNKLTGNIYRTSIFSIIPLPMFLGLLVMVMGKIIRIPKVCWHPLFISLFILVYVFSLNRDLYLYGFIRAWIMPIVVVCALYNCKLSGKTRNTLINILFIFVICNFLVSYMEKMAGQHLVMTNIDNINAEKMGVTFESFEFRSNGLMGHPLGCGQLTSLFYSFILISGCSHKKKMIFSLFAFIAMLCFNVRFSLVTCVISFFIYILMTMKDSKHKFLLFSSVSFFVLICVYILYNTGLGGRIMNIGLYGSDDSSLARTEIFALFNYIDVSTLLYGLSDTAITKAMYNSGTENMIIENPFIVYSLSLGVVLTTLLFFVFSKFIYKMTLEWTFGKRVLVFVPFLMNIFSNISLAGGATSLSLLIMFIYLYEYRQSLFYSK